MVEEVDMLAKDDYHVIAYQILSYLYQQLKSGAPVDEQMLSAEALFGINEKYRGYILKNLLNDGYITGILVKESKYINGQTNLHFLNLDECEITPKGIEYLTDNSFLNTAKEFFKDVKSMAPFV